METEQFKAFLALMMCSDPWPVENDSENQPTVEQFANEEAERHGFASWIEAYHKL